LDNVTHSLFGLTLARTPLGRAGQGTTVALLLASNAPDIDIVTTAGGAVRYLESHRGVTHGPLGLIVLSFAAAGLAWLGVRWRNRDASPRFGALWAVAAVGVLCHVLMDLPTSYGTRPFSPFSWMWFTTDWLPIVDIYLLAILGAGLWFGRTARGRNAAIALMLMAADYGVRAASHHAAIAAAPEVFGAPLPPACADLAPQRTIVDRWPRPGAAATDDTATGPLNEAYRPYCLLDLAAMPDFVSPFKWRLIAQLSNSYEIRDVDLLNRSTPASTVRRLSTRYPNQWTPAVFRAAGSDVGRVFLGFSRFPAARSVRDADGRTTVRWSDMRFINNGIRGGQQTSGLFSAVVEIGPDGRIVRQRLGEPLGSR
jgi:inner membrane protein